MFETIAHLQSLNVRQGVDAIDASLRDPHFTYAASSSVAWWKPNDIQAHIEPTKSAGAPDVPATMPNYWDSESNAYCSVGGSVSGMCALVTATF